MGAKVIRKTRFAVLCREIHSIHRANRLFWGRTSAHSRESGVEYYRRQDRLETIRRELDGLTH
jgi:hypothetical protein